MLSSMKSLMTSSKMHDGWYLHAQIQGKYTFLTVFRKDDCLTHRCLTKTDMKKKWLFV